MILYLIATIILFAYVFFKMVKTVKNSEDIKEVEACFGVALLSYAFLSMALDLFFELVTDAR